MTQRLLPLILVPLIFLQVVLEVLAVATVDLLSRGWRRGWRLLGREECELCCETVFSMRIHPASSTCNHRCCSSCWVRYFKANEAGLIDRLRRRRSMQCLSCFACPAPIYGPVLARFASREMLNVSARVERREELEAKAKTLGFECVECPNCAIGVGYDDGHQPFAMCFMCEHQWSLARRRFGLGAIVDWISTIMPQKGAWPTERSQPLEARNFHRRRHTRVRQTPLTHAPTAVAVRGAPGWRPCPHCGEAIVKDGGCPMMCAPRPQKRGRRTPAHPWAVCMCVCMCVCMRICMRAYVHVRFIPGLSRRSMHICMRAYVHVRFIPGLSRRSAYASDSTALPAPSLAYKSAVSRVWRMSQP